MPFGDPARVWGSTLVEQACFDKRENKRMDYRLDKTRRFSGIGAIWGLVIGCLACALCCTSCGTIRTRASESKSYIDEEQGGLCIVVRAPFFGKYPYQAVIDDIAYMRSSQYSGIWLLPLPFESRPYSRPLDYLTIPFDIALDTAFLPFDLIAWFFGAEKGKIEPRNIKPKSYAVWSSICYRRDKQFWEEVFSAGVVPAEGLQRHWSVYMDEQVGAAIREPGVSSNLLDSILASAIVEDRAKVIADISALPMLSPENCRRIYAWQKVNPKKGQRIRRNLAGNPILPMEILLSLAETDMPTQVEVLKSERVPPDLFTEMTVRLARSDNWDVKLAIARNPRTSPVVLTELAKEAVPEGKSVDLEHYPLFMVSCALAGNTNTPPQAFDILINETRPPLPDLIAENPSTPTYILEALMKTKRPEAYFILRSMTRNAGAPRSIIETLAESDIHDVRDSAKVELRRRNTEEQKKAKSLNALDTK